MLNTLSPFSVNIEETKKKKRKSIEILHPIHEKVTKSLNLNIIKQSDSK